MPTVAESKPQKIKEKREVKKEEPAEVIQDSAFENTNKLGVWTTSKSKLNVDGASPSESEEVTASEKSVIVKDFKKANTSSLDDVSIKASSPITKKEETPLSSTSVLKNTKDSREIVLSVLEKALEAREDTLNQELHSYLTKAKDNLLQDATIAKETKSSIAKSAAQKESVPVLSLSESIKQKLPFFKTKPKCIPIEQSDVADEELAPESWFKTSGREQLTKWLKSIDILETLLTAGHQGEECLGSRKDHQALGQENASKQKEIGRHSETLMQDIVALVESLATSKQDREALAHNLDKIGCEAKSVLELLVTQAEEKEKSQDYSSGAQSQLSIPFQEATSSNESTIRQEVLHYDEKKKTEDEAGRMATVGVDSNVHLRTDSLEVT